MTTRWWRVGSAGRHPNVQGATPRVLFLGLNYAGHQTRFANLQAHTTDDPRIRPSYRCVTGWKPDGLIERLPVVPAGVKGHARALLEAAPLAMLPRPDVIWNTTVEIATPYLWSQLGSLKRPLVQDLDCTYDQLEDLAPVYFGRASRPGLLRTLARLRERALWRSVSVFTPWSRWAADGLRRQGIAEDRIRVLPPGIDLDAWHLGPERGVAPQQRLRLLFVGGDFDRKGGQILLDVFRDRFSDRCDLDIVTRDAVPTVAGARVHRAEANSPLLRSLYATADLFVLPTRAECFGIAAVEALASGLPVILGNSGGTPDIVDDGETGWLVEPTRDHLAQVLEHALAQRDTLPSMGRRARHVAEERFDGKRNDARVVDLLVAEADRHRAARHRAASGRARGAPQ
jgi:glycosyltransferase involved in cell wall biosynthesis